MECPKHGYWSALWVDECQPCANERAAAFVDAMPVAPRFIMADEVSRATSRKVHDENWWAAQGIPMPTRYVLDSIAIPESIRKDTERDTDTPEPSDAMRLIGREVCADTRRYDEREMFRADKAGADDGY